MLDIFFLLSLFEQRGLLLVLVYGVRTCSHDRNAIMRMEIFCCEVIACIANPMLCIKEGRKKEKGSERTILL